MVRWNTVIGWVKFTMNESTALFHTVSAFDQSIFPPIGCTGFFMIFMIQSFQIVTPSLFVVARDTWNFLEVSSIIDALLRVIHCILTNYFHWLRDSHQGAHSSAWNQIKWNKEKSQKLFNSNQIQGWQFIQMRMLASLLLARLKVQMKKETNNVTFCHWEYGPLKI